MVFPGAVTSGFLFPGFDSNIASLTSSLVLLFVARYFIQATVGLSESIDWSS